MQKSTLILLLLLISLPVFSQPHKYLKTGFNYSQIFVENSRGRMGVSFGIGRESKIFSRVYWASELYFCTIAGSLLKKKVHYYPGVTYYPIDLHYSLGYVRVPLLIKYKIPQQNNNLFLFLGPHICFGIFDASEVYSPTDAQYKEDPESSNISYDYGECFDCGPRFLNTLFNSFIGINAGVELQISSYIFEFRCIRSTLYQIYAGSPKTLNEPYYTFMFQIGVFF